MIINLKVSVAQFIDLFSDNTDVNFFSDEAVGVILERVAEKMKEDEGTDSAMTIDDFMMSFKEALEFSAEAVYFDHREELLEHTSEVLAIARNLPVMDYATIQLLVNKDNIDENELLTQAEPNLSMSDEFMEKVASIYAKKHDILELKNGYFMKFP